MPQFRPRKNRLATTYRRRAESFGRETARHRGRVGKLLRKGLQDATQEELYDRTPLPVTRDLFRSIRIRFHGNVVHVGYTFGRGARYAKYRINMTGISKLGGHLLDMRPAQWIRRNVDNDIRRSARKALQDSMETK